MIESVKQVHMDEGGKIDKARGGVGGKSKQRRTFLEEMRKSGKREFLFSDLQRIASIINLPLGGFRDFLDYLRGEGDLMMGSNGSSTFYTLIS